MEFWHIIHSCRIFRSELHRVAQWIDILALLANHQIRHCRDAMANVIIHLNTYHYISYVGTRFGKQKHRPILSNRNHCINQSLGSIPLWCTLPFWFLLWIVWFLPDLILPDLGYDINIWLWIYFRYFDPGLRCLTVEADFAMVLIWCLFSLSEISL